MRVDFICTYCDEHFHDYLYNADQAESMRCIKCKDESLKVFVKKDDDGDVFGYNKDKKPKDAYIKKDKA